MVKMLLIGAAGYTGNAITTRGHEVYALARGLSRFHRGDRTVSFW